MKKVIFIDWNRTLSFDLFWEHLKDTGHRYHHHLEPIEKWLFVDNRSLINQWMRGNITVDEIVQRISNGTGISPDVIMNELRHSCEIMKFCIVDIEELIGDIRNKGMLVVIATDNMDTFTRFTVPALKLNDTFDGVLNSHDLKCLKDETDPKASIPFFDDFLTSHDLTYADAILLDDSPDSSGKYEKLGFERILIDGPDTLQKTLEILAYGE